MTGPQAPDDKDDAMIRHVAMWAYIDSEDVANREKAVTVKTVLEDLKYLIEGMAAVEVHIDPLPGCDAAFLVDCLFENEEALKSYLEHPSRLRILDLLRSFAKGGICMNCRTP